VSEGIALLLEGVEPALVENAGRLAGMPVGPLALADEVSLELIDKIAKQTEADLGDAYVPPPSAPVVTKLVHELGRIGKKAGSGFYDYPEGESKRLWPGLRELYPPKDGGPTADALGQRLLAIQAVETIRCLEEGVITHPADADIGSILGWGFAPFHGGVLSYVDTIGPRVFLERCEALARAHGARFEPPKTLRAMAEVGRRFHGA
jgi:3-hydroxyacyl-CoA dehydrogenase/enoyl-CoA hydratase/3-hydroxybutyryl-CoA epimerase